MNQNIFVKIFLCVLFGVAFIANIGTLKDGHNWGDDFSQYIICAKNIVEYKNYSSGVMLDNPTIYPPGFPLLIAPLVKFFGINFKILKSLNVVFWYLSLFLLYQILLKNRLSKTAALMSCIFLAFSSHFFIFKQNILADIPFFFFVCLTFWTFHKWHDLKQAGDISGQRLVFALFLFIGSYAFWIRSVGVLLFVTAFFYFMLIERRRLLALLVLLILLVNIFVQMSVIGVHPGFLTVIYDNPLSFFLMSLSNSSVVFRSVAWFFCPPLTKISYVCFNFIDHALILIVPFLGGILFILFCVKTYKRTLSFIEFFSFFYLLIFIFWSGFAMAPGEYTRFILPLALIVFIWAYRLFFWLDRFLVKRGMQQSFFKGFVRIIFLLLLCMNFINIFSSWKFNDDVINLKENKELIIWVKGHVKTDEHFMFWKPRMMALLTERVGTAPWVTIDQQERFYERIKQFRISYVILYKTFDRVLISSLEDNNSLAQVVWENEFYKIFKINEKSSKL